MATSEASPLPVQTVPSVIRLPERLTVDQAAEILQSFKSASTASVIVEFDDVINVDTAGLQLLLMVRQWLGERGSSCEWRAVPELVIEEARMLGLAQRLELGSA